MAKKKKNPQAFGSRKPKEEEVDLHRPWLNMRSGITAVLTISVLLGIYVGWQVYPTDGLQNAILTGFVAGFSLIPISLAFYFFQTTILGRGRRSKAE